MMTASLVNMVNSHFFLVVRILRSTVLVALNNAVFKNQTLYPLLPVSTAVVMDVREIQERVFGNHWSTQGKENAPSPPPPAPRAFIVWWLHTQHVWEHTGTCIHVPHEHTELGSLVISRLESLIVSLEGKSMVFWRKRSSVELFPHFLSLVTLSGGILFVYRLVREGKDRILGKHSSQ